MNKDNNEKVEIINFSMIKTEILNQLLKEICTKEYIINP